MCVHFETEEEYAAYEMDQDHTAALRADKRRAKAKAARRAKDDAAIPPLTPAERLEKATFEMQLREVANKRKFALIGRD